MRRTWSTYMTVMNATSNGISHELPGSPRSPERRLPDFANGNRGTLMAPAAGYPFTESGSGCGRPCQNRLVEDGALNGGNVSDVRKIGDAVVCRQGSSAFFVHSLLRHLADVGWVGSPRVLGVDDDGHETLTFLEGVVPWQPPVPDWALSDAALTALARLVRQLHDLTADSDLAGSAEVVCHGDLAPGNTVYRSTAAGLAPVAFLDWDLAGPGRRIEDVAHVCWQWLDLGPGVPDVAEAARRIALIADAYGLIERGDLIPAILWWQDRCWRGIETAAVDGDPAMQRLVSDKVPDQIRQSYAWTVAHQHELA